MAPNSGPQAGRSVTGQGSADPDLWRARWSSPLLRGLADADVEALLSRADIRRLTAGHLFGLEGQRHDRCYVVIDGMVKQQRATMDGCEVITGVRGAGEVLNAHVAFEPSVLPYTLVTLNSAVLLQIAGADLRCLVASHPRLMSSLAAVLDHQLSQSLEDAVWAGCSSTTARILRRLIELTELCGVETAEGVVVTFALSQEELGSWSGSSRESVARLFQRMRADGVMVTGRRFLLVRDLDRLRRNLRDCDTVGLAPVSLPAGA